MPDGHALCRTQFVKRLRLLLSATGVDASLFSAHSFLIEAASAAANVNIPVYLIKIPGSWSSSAYRRYLRFSTSTLAQTHSAMASPITASIGVFALISSSLELMALFPRFLRARKGWSTSCPNKLV